MKYASLPSLRAWIINGIWSQTQTQSFFFSIKLITGYIVLVVKIQSLIIRCKLQKNNINITKSADGHIEKTQNRAIKAMCPITT